MDKSLSEWYVMGRTSRLTSELLYDPPSGWKYGFPKPYKGGRGDDLKHQLILDGYPQSEIDSLGDNLHVRFIGGED